MHFQDDEEGEKHVRRRRAQHIKFDQILQRDLRNVLMQRHEIYDTFTVKHSDEDLVLFFCTVGGESGRAKRLSECDFLILVQIQNKV